MQSKGMEDSPPKELNKMEVSKLSDIEFKIMVTKMLKELTDNYKELSLNYNSKKGNRNYKQKPGRNEQLNLRSKNTLEGITSRLDEPDNRIIQLEDKVEKNTQK